MRKGVLFFDERGQIWRIMIDQDIYEIFTGMNLEIRITDRYYKACFEEDYGDWFVTLEDEVDFSLRLVETYHVQALEKTLIPAFDLPF